VITSPPLPPATRTVVAVAVGQSAFPPLSTATAASANAVYSFITPSYCGGG
jgi:hypothetical protein